MPLKGLSGEEVGIPRSGENSRIRTRIYKRFGSRGPVPALLYLHGGGYFIETRDCIVIAPDYRKSFEAPYPAAIDDCYSLLVSFVLMKRTCSASTSSSSGAPKKPA